MFLRVALMLWGDDLDRVRETYDATSLKKFTHASPTLFNAGMKVQQLSSCYLISTASDSIEGIFDAVTKCAKISKYGGGIGVSIQNVRGRGAPIKGTNGTSDGIVPMLRVFNSVADYVNQGGRRKGAIAMYTEPWHPDVFEFLDMRRNQGEEHLRAREL
jgi:ribonucleotide reductase alpha subunit